MKKAISLLLTIILLSTSILFPSFSGFADLVNSQELPLNTNTSSTVYFNSADKKVYYKVNMSYAGCLELTLSNMNTIGSTEAKIIVSDELFSCDYGEYHVSSNGKPNTIIENIYLYSGVYYIEISTVESYGYSLSIKANCEYAPEVNSSVESPNTANDIALGYEYVGMLKSHFNYYGFELNTRSVVKLTSTQNKSLVFCLMKSNATDEISREQMESPSGTFQYILEPGRYYLRFGGNGLFYTSENQIYHFKLEYVTPENCIHEFESSYVKSTCYSFGYTQHTCSICGYSYADDYTKLANHKYDSQTIYPTYFSDGYTHYVCSVCGHNYNDRFVSKYKLSKPVIYKNNNTKGMKKSLKVNYSYIYDATGYQIQYSTNKKFTKKSTKTVNTKSTTKTIKKLKAKKTYYVRVRAYVKSGNKTAYSSWSAKKTIKTK